MKRVVVIGMIFIWSLCVVIRIGEAALVEEGKKVQFDYTLKVDGEVVETSIGKTPLEYVHGEGTIIPGLSVALEGMDIGEEKTVIVEPEEAYGLVIEEAIKDVPKENFPDGFDFNIGTVIQLQDPDGNDFPGIVWELKDDRVVVNFNHPLAGKTLVFDVTIVSVE